MGRGDLILLICQLCGQGRWERHKGSAGCWHFLYQMGPVRSSALDTQRSPSLEVGQKQAFPIQAWDIVPGCGDSAGSAAAGCDFGWDLSSLCLEFAVVAWEEFWVWPGPVHFSKGTGCPRPRGVAEKLP